MRIAAAPKPETKAGEGMMSAETSESEGTFSDVGKKFCCTIISKREAKEETECPLAREKQQSRGTVFGLTFDTRRLASTILSVGGGFFRQWSLGSNYLFNVCIILEKTV